ncbi:hypothetical protein HII17_17875 [Thalassotalea sp. M1531]|uniref:Uncharacterized protein n=1 Tax=Thalassotalea algicola TaxID=2716224 RepID=A0A7Y0LF70_9GAMM|nr:hypothetical protein [Thalassotalea algicola]NMP33420.1 hypothetical protein [Thalassotalea algicola]
MDKLVKYLLLPLCIYVLSITKSVAYHTALDISGSWKHSEKPAWIQINFTNNVGEAVVFDHKNNIKANGLTVINQITANSDNNAEHNFHWSAKMYSMANDNFVDVKLTLATDDTLIVFALNEHNAWYEVLKLHRQLP